MHTLAAFGRWLGPRDGRVLVPSDVHRVPTRDAHTLALRRVHGPGLGRGVPVLLVPGLGGSGDAFLLAARSIAAYLAAAGFDCFVADLRGRGESCADDGSRRFDWGLGAYLEHDLPTLINAVLSLTGQPRLHWVGHSMGGILGYAHLSSTRDARLRGLVTLGSALDFTHGASAFQALARHKHLIAHMPYVPVASMARVVARLVHVAPRLMAGFSYHPDNLEPDVARPYLAHTLCEVAPRELADLCSALEPGGLRCPRTDAPFAAAAGEIATPVLAVAGDDDQQCPPAAVAATLALLGSADKTYLCVGRAQGSPAPFGHEDLVVGRYAAPVLWPALVRWLADH